MRSTNEQCTAEERHGFAHPFLILAFTFLISHFSFLTSNAQTFTDRLQQSTAGQGKVTVQQSADIDQLVNNATLAPRQAATTNTQHPSPNTQHPSPYTTQHPSPNTQHPAIHRPRYADSQRGSRRQHQKDYARRCQGQRLSRTGLCRRQFTQRPPAGRKDWRRHQGRLSRRTYLRPLLLPALDLPRRQLSQLRGSPPDAGQPAQDGILASHHRQGKNHSTILLSFKL